MQAIMTLLEMDTLAEIEVSWLQAAAVLNTEVSMPWSPTSYTAFTLECSNGLQRVQLHNGGARKSVTGPCH